MTIQEMYIYLDVEAQRLDSKLLNSFEIEEKDWLLNISQLQFVKTRISNKSNPKREGFEDTTKRYDDLKELKKSVDIPVYYLDGESVYGFLPVDYFHHINSRTETYYNCSQIGSKSSTATTLRITSVTFPTPTNGTGYSVMIFTIPVGGTNYVYTVSANFSAAMLAQLYDTEMKFYIISSVLDYFNSRYGTIFNVYWERFNDVYAANAFIIVSNSTIGTPAYSGGITFATSPVVTTANKSLYPYTMPTGAIISKVPNRLTSSENIWEAARHSFHKSIYDSPLVVLETNTIRVIHSGDFYVNKVMLQYIKKPLIMSYSENVSCELSANVHEEILHIATQKLKAYVNAGDYKNIINENSVME